MESLKNKTVLITGSSAGIGRACAIEFAKAGARLIVCARRGKLLDTLADELRSTYGSDVFTVEMDVRNRTGVFETVEGLPQEWSDVDILVNNAGLGRGLDKFQDGNLDDWDEMIDTNVKGLLNVTRALLPAMVERDKGHIINIGSIAGHESYPGGNVYNASKFAVDALTKALRMDLVATALRVSTVDPGLVETDFSIVRFHGDKERANAVYTDIEACKPEDVAEAVIFCATRPAHVSINQVVIMPTAQASALVQHRAPK